MPLMVKDTGSDFEPIETGLQQAVCSHAVDLGLQYSEMFGYRMNLAICFELKQKMTDGRPFMLSRLYGASLNEKATLRKDLESWRGKKFTEQELEGFDLEQLIGVNAYLNIVEDVKGDKKYYKWAAIAPAPKGETKLKPIGQPLPEWLQKKAAEGAKNLADQGGEKPQKRPTSAEAKAAKDDLPF